MTKQTQASAVDHLQALIGAGHITSKEQLLEEVRNQGWHIPRIEDDFITIGVSGRRPFRFRFSLDGTQEEGWVYALLAMNDNHRACYIGCTVDFQRRLAEHVRVQQLAHLFSLGTSTEFFRWAAQRRLIVRSLLIERVLGPSNLAHRESSWTMAAQRAGWTLPGVERWGRKAPREISRPPVNGTGSASYHEADFQSLDLSKAKTLRVHVLGHDQPDEPFPDASGLTPASQPANNETQMDNGDVRQFNRHTVCFLVNPLNRRPFFIGMAEGQESDIALIDLAPDVIARNQIMHAIYECGEQILAVEIDRADNKVRAKALRSFWVELMLRSGADIVNIEASNDARLRAVQVHLTACGMPLDCAPPTNAAGPAQVPASGKDSEGTPEAAPLQRNAASEAPISANAARSPDLPARHGEKWREDEQEMVAQRFLQGHAIADIASDQQRKESSILAKLVKMAAANEHVRSRLLTDGLTDPNGKPAILIHAGNSANEDRPQDSTP